MASLPSSTNSSPHPSLQIHNSVDILDTATLTSYITYARQHVHPVLGDDAAEDLIEAYLDLRRLGGNKKVITATPRQLESLIRLSESLARMRYSETVRLSCLLSSLAQPLEGWAAPKRSVLSFVVLFLLLCIGREGCVGVIARDALLRDGGTEPPYFVLLFCSSRIELPFPFCPFWYSRKASVSEVLTKTRTSKTVQQSCLFFAFNRSLSFQQTYGIQWRDSVLRCLV